ncbi:hypothetical protein BVC93_32370 (plasmid) [Mycobacterium sp. MS1601]|nr:hypothetical protein BVC93_32370 [Mycobacterium sp. MS1601]
MAFGGTILGLTMIQGGQYLPGSITMLIGVTVLIGSVLRQVSTVRRAPHLAVRVLRIWPFAGRRGCPGCTAV